MPLEKYSLYRCVMKSMGFTDLALAAMMRMRKLGYSLLLVADWAVIFKVTAVENSWVLDSSDSRRIEFIWRLVRDFNILVYSPYIV